MFGEAFAYDRPFPPHEQQYSFQRARPSDLVNRKNATEFEAAYKFGEILNPFEK